MGSCVSCATSFVKFHIIIAAKLTSYLQDYHPQGELTIRMAELAALMYHRATHVLGGKVARLRVMGEDLGSESLHSYRNTSLGEHLEIDAQRSVALRIGTPGKVPLYVCKVPDHAFTVLQTALVPSDDVPAREYYLARFPVLPTLFDESVEWLTSCVSNVVDNVRSLASIPVPPFPPTVVAVKEAAWLTDGEPTPTE